MTRTCCGLPRRFLIQDGCAWSRGQRKLSSGRGSRNGDHRHDQAIEESRAHLASPVAVKSVQLGIRVTGANRAAPPLGKARHRRGSVAVGRPARQLSQRRSPARSDLRRGDAHGQHDDSQDGPRHSRDQGPERDRDQHEPESGGHRSHQDLDGRRHHAFRAVLARLACGVSAPRSASRGRGCV
jgi:hypothetical protein